MAEFLNFDDLRLLEVCRNCTQNGEFCGAWIKIDCDQKGIPFHQAQLGKLVRAGYLEKLELSRAGKRRYYRLTA